MKSPRLRKRILVLVGSCIVGIFVCLQFRSWKEFDWWTFWAQTSHAKVVPLASAVALIYLSYIVLIMRWKVFLAPLRRSSVTRLLRPTAVGFTGLILLGRPGELIRPYLIAKSEGTSLSSQLAMWFVERALDLLACTLLIAISVIADPALHSLPYLGRLRAATLVVVVALVGMSATTFLLRRKAGSLVAWVRAACRRAAGDAAWKAADEIEAFIRELFTVPSFLKVGALSLLLWCLNGVACWEVMRAYPEPLHHFEIWQAIVVMGFGILGSVIQLPAVGGGSQLATIAALVHVYGVPKETAVSCGISLWLVMFASIVPIGLLMAHREGLSLKKLSHEGKTSSVEVPESAVAGTGSFNPSHIG